MKKRGKAMSTREYLAALRRLGLTPYGNETAARLGVGRSTLANYAAGRRVPRTVALLLSALLTIEETK